MGTPSPENTNDLLNKIPDGCVVNLDVRIVQYMNADGKMSYAMQVAGDTQVSTIVGLLTMAAWDVSQRNHSDWRDS